MSFRPSLDLTEILAQTGIQSPDRPARNESLYHIRYPDPPWYP